MTGENLFLSFKKYFKPEETVKAVFSGSKTGNRKIIIRPVTINNTKKWQMEELSSGKAFHKNLPAEELLAEIGLGIIADFKQINIVNKKSSVQFLVSKKGKIAVRETKTGEHGQNLSHDKLKKYIFREGDDIAPLIDLGIFNRDNKIIKSKYDKYKQINRFIQIIDDEIKQFDKQEITVADFGCGKSYLTFLLYYYFNSVRNIHPTIYGYDLKQDVIDDCNRIAAKYHYTDLQFFNADIANLEKLNNEIDLVITLHACDTATDYALYNAIKNKIKYIFSVPCCQHEINLQIKTADEMNLLLTDGLIKERFSALLTDAVRCEILREAGYTVDAVEFVDFSHSPKNLMIRAVLNKEPRHNYENVNALLKRFDITQKLFSLIREQQPDS